MEKNNENMLLLGTTEEVYCGCEGEHSQKQVERPRLDPTMGGRRQRAARSLRDQEPARRPRYYIAKMAEGSI